MSKLFRIFRLMALLLLCGGALSSAAAEAKALAPEQMQKLNLKLIETLSPALVEVDYFFKVDEQGEMPELSVGYMCPNCNSMHYESVSSLIEEQRPQRSPGFAVASDEFITTDIFVGREYLEKLEIVFNGRRYAGRIVEYYPDLDSVKIKTTEAVTGVKPLQFNPAAAGRRFAFFRVEEDGVAVAAAAPFESPAVYRNLSTGRDYLELPANTLLVNENAEVVGLSMAADLELGTDWTLPPDRWRTVDAAEHDKQLAAFSELLNRNIYPAQIRLKPIRQSKGSRYYSNREDDKNEIDAFAIKFKDGRVLLVANLTPADTARLARINILVDGKEIPAQFIGSLPYYGALVVEPEKALPGAGLELYEESNAKESGSPVYNTSLRNFGKNLKLRTRRGRLNDLTVGFRGIVMPERNREKLALVFSADGRLMALKLEKRSLERYGRSESLIPMQLTSELMQDFDPTNVPSADGEKLAWLGIEFQKIDADLARANQAASFTENGEYGVMISHVYAGSPAADLGLKAGDIIISVTPEGSFKPEKLDSRFQQFDAMGGIPFPWDRYDEIPAQYYDEIPVPWGTTRTELNNFLGKIGIGRQATLAVVSDGKLTEHKFTVSAAPMSFDTITKFTDDKLGLSVCDFTYEVRNYFQLKPEDSGVMVARVKAGGRAAVAGVKPYEMIVSVNGQPVKDLETFKTLIADQTELKLGVRRMAVSRLVTIKLD